MGTLKLAAWIFVLYVIQNIFCPILTITGFVPDLLFGFALSYSALDLKFRRISYVTLICALLCGTGTGRIFSIAVLMTGVGAMLSYFSRDYFRFIPQIIRTEVIVAVFSFIMCCCEYFARTGTVSYTFLTNTASVYTVYTTVTSAVIYLILKKIIHNRDTKLLIHERD